MTKIRYNDIYPYCDKSDCTNWSKCSLAATESVRSNGEPEIKEHHACYEQEKGDSDERK